MILLFITVNSTQALSATIYVPDDYSMIQVAVDAVNSRNTINIGDGIIYTENVGIAIKSEKQNYNLLEDN